MLLMEVFKMGKKTIYAICLLFLVGVAASLLSVAFDSSTGAAFLAAGICCFAIAGGYIQSVFRAQL